MPLDAKLLEVLICPVCKADLEVKKDESGLMCVECRRVYPVRNGIPIMIVDEATIEPLPPAQ